MKLDYKKDLYVSNRKGYSEFFKLHCSKCGTLISYYQKDGPGALLRTYVDRMIEEEPRSLPVFKINDKLLCPHCRKMLGLAYIYQKEERPAYALFQDAIRKKPVSYLKHIWCYILGLFRH